MIDIHTTKKMTDSELNSYNCIDKIYFLSFYEGEFYGI